MEVPVHEISNSHLLESSSHGRLGTWTPMGHIQSFNRKCSSQELWPEGYLYLLWQQPNDPLKNIRGVSNGEGLLVTGKDKAEQCGFHPHCGTMDQIFLLLLKESWELDQQVYMCFVELEDKNYVPQGVCGGCSGIMGYRSCCCKVFAHILGTKSCLFMVHVGLLPVHPLSTILFVVFIDRILRPSWGKEWHLIQASRRADCFYKHL